MTAALNYPVNDTLAEAISRLVEHFRPDRIYLFGSRARGQATEDSDYDLLVVVPESTDPGHKRMRDAYRVLWEVDLPVEVIVLSRAEFERDLAVVSSLPSAATREGRLLYGG